MAYLEKFSSEDMETLIRLPYRAGLWVSIADDTGGGEASAEEVEALHNIITRKARGMFESAFVHEVFEELFKKQDEWKQWGESLHEVPDECESVRAAIEAKLSPHDLRSFRESILGIGIQVARAFREFDVDAPLPVKLWTWLRLNIDQIIGLIKGADYVSEALLNISYEEDVALARLSGALTPDEDDDRSLEDLPVS